MAKIKPFRGVRPVSEKIRQVASPPYDVIDSREARKLAAGNPYSFLHVVKPEIDLPESIDIYDPRVYEKGRENLYRMIEEGILKQDPEYCFYLYRLIMGDIIQTGLVVGASIEDYEADVIKKHEHTRADKEADRIRHVDTLNANTGPVFLTYKSRTDMNNLVSLLTKSVPEYDFLADDGVRHIFWKICDKKVIRKIINIFAGIEFLYVADGHHRSASGTRVGQMRRERNARHTGKEEYNYFLGVLFPHDQLHIMAYNRIVKDLNNLSEAEFLEAVSRSFHIEKYPDDSPGKPRTWHEFGMYLNGVWYRLTAREGSFPAHDPVKSLDVSILQDNLLSPILAIGDPRTDKRIDFVGGIRGLQELARRVDQGEAVAFTLYPTSIEQLMAIADSGKVMPPKSTWFEPKLRSGLIIHLLD
ncbi:MAG: DUF1015 domain-containing protein [Candidatus Cloacimonetes bacterium]|nr:DUF1015 domain-containing protein [Candidatus Cloacimonadota bacterium]